MHTETTRNKLGLCADDFNAVIEIFSAHAVVEVLVAKQQLPSCISKLHRRAGLLHDNACPLTRLG